jgi:hypothetical protein
MGLAQDKGNTYATAVVYINTSKRDVEQNISITGISVTFGTKEISICIETELN